MLKKTALLTVSVAMFALLAGCGAGSTPAEIAESYGILNRLSLQKDIAGVIQSGQADYMIEAGHANVRSRVQGSGKDRLLVTEYLIHGEPYRIEVRRAVNPLKNIPWYEITSGHSRQGSDTQDIDGLHVLNVASVLRNNSYEAEPTIAYRAWQDLDGKIHPVRVMKGQTPNWQPTDDAMNLTIRTRGDWPFVTLWVRGITVDGRRRDPNTDVAYPGSPETSADDAIDGQWILESPGTGVQGQRTAVEGRTHFVNMKLYDAIQACNL